MPNLKGQGVGAIRELPLLNIRSQNGVGAIHELPGRWITGKKVVKQDLIQ